MDFSYNIKLQVNILRATSQFGFMCVIKTKSIFKRATKTESVFMFVTKTKLILQCTKTESIFSKQATKTESNFSKYQHDPNWFLEKN